MNTLRTQKLGSHLASPPYYDDIVALLNKYPTLKYPDDKRYEDYPFQQPTSSRSRVACLEFLDSGLVSHRVYFDLDRPRDIPNRDPVAGARRLFLLEELQPAYVTILGHRLRIPPTVFLLIAARHCGSTTIMQGTHHRCRRSTTPRRILPSSIGNLFTSRIRSKTSIFAAQTMSVILL